MQLTYVDFNFSSVFSTHDKEEPFCIFILEDDFQIGMHRHRLGF